MIRIYRCKFCGKIKEVEVNTSKEDFGSLDMYIKNYSEKFLTHQCNSGMIGVMELVAIER